MHIKFVLSIVSLQYRQVLTTTDFTMRVSFVCVLIHRSLYTVFHIGLIIMDM